MPAKPKMLVLTPTRELALQVQKAANTYGSGIGRLRTVCLVGGMPYPEQIRQLGAPVDVIVATPGLVLHTVVSSDPAKVAADHPEGEYLKVLWCRVL